MTGLEAAVIKLQIASSGKQDSHYKHVVVKYLSSCCTMLIASASTCLLFPIDHWSQSE